MQRSHCSGSDGFASVFLLASAVSMLMSPSLSSLPSVAAWSCDLRHVAAPSTATRFHRGKGSNFVPDRMSSKSPPLFATKWDNLIDEDDDLELEFNGGPPVAKDMKYNFFNIKRMRDNFDAIREVGGKEVTNDVYVRNPEMDTFWFIGKLARVSDVSLELTAARIWPMIEEHAARLRPVDLYPKWGSLEIWTAPGDSELDVAYNRPENTFQKMMRDVDGAADVRIVEVGFQGEVYEKDEEGFRTVRTEDGRPVNPEIQSAAEKRQPSDTEMDDVMDMLNSQIEASGES